MHYQLIIHLSLKLTLIHKLLCSNLSFFCQRAQVVNGLYEPNDEECLNPWRDENEDEELARAIQSAAITEGEKKEGEETKAIE